MGDYVRGPGPRGGPRGPPVPEGVHVDYPHALAFNAEGGSYFPLLHPAFAVAVPHPLTIRFPLAYPVARPDQAFARFLGIWIDPQSKNGTIQALCDHWILGRDARPRQPHWSVIRNALHWVK